MQQAPPLGALPTMQQALAAAPLPGALPSAFPAVSMQQAPPPGALPSVSPAPSMQQAPPRGALPSVLPAPPTPQQLPSTIVLPADAPPSALRAPTPLATQQPLQGIMRHSDIVEMLRYSTSDNAMLLLFVLEEGSKRGRQVCNLSHVQ